MLVFLDFDGVLHPFPCHYGVFFCQRAVLEKFFGRPEYESAQFVITSTWRNHHPLEALREWFGETFRQRIIGTTPKLDVAWDGSREREIRAWLRQHRRAEEAWIALDDMQQFFEPECRNLFLCDGSTGLTEADYPQLAAHIARLGQTQKAT